MNGYITTSEAAKMVGVTQQAIIQQLWQQSRPNKILKGIKLGRDWLVEKSSVEEYRKERNAKLARRKANVAVAAEGK